MTERKELKQRYDAAKSAVTTVHPVLDLDNKVRAPIESCINVYERVVGPGVNEQSDFTLECEHLKSGNFCSNTRCDYYAQHMEYIMARDAYSKAR